MTTRDELIAAMRATASPKPIPVEVAGWPALHVRPLTVAEVEEAADFKEPDDGKRRRFARGAARLICDENGVRIFDPKNDDDVTLLAEQPWSMLQKVTAAAEGKTEGN